MSPVAGKRAIVTGGASGIGAATARALAHRGADVLVADRDVRLGCQVAEEIGGIFFELDVADPRAWARMPEVDLVHLNAGVMSGQQPVALENLTVEAWTRVRGVNLDGVAYGIVSTAEGMARRGGGAIVCTSSGAGLGVFPPDPFYAATKHGVIGLARSLAPALAARGITIGVVCPPRTETPMYRAAAGERAKGAQPVLPAAAVGEVVAEILAGEASVTAAVPGAVVRIEADGSYHLHEFVGELGRPPG